MDSNIGISKKGLCYTDAEEKEEKDGFEKDLKVDTVGDL